MARQRLGTGAVRPGGIRARPGLPLALALCTAGGACAPSDEDTRVSAALRASAPVPRRSPRSGTVLDDEPKGRLVIGPSGGGWRSPYVEPPGGEIEFVSLQHSGLPPAPAIEKQVIRDEQTFRRFWERLHPFSGNAPPPPRLDFTNVMVLYVPMGEKPFYYDVRVQKVIENEREITVLVDEYWPGEVCIYPSPQAEVRPYHLVTIAQSPLPVVFAVGIRRYCP